LLGAFRVKVSPFACSFVSSKASWAGVAGRVKVSGMILIIKPFVSLDAFRLSRRTI
jgi:hypothetical protein